MLHAASTLFIRLVVSSTRRLLIDPQSAVLSWGSLSDRIHVRAEHGCPNQTGFGELRF